MLQFEVFDARGPAKAWPLVNAHLLGRDDLPVPGTIEFRNGVIVCTPRDPRAAALCLEYDAGRMGRLMLQTCLLAQRQEPYRLNQELARHRIKVFIAKSEEWIMFDPGLAGEALERWEQAREIFVEASAIGDSAISEAKNAEALSVAIDASERLAMRHAQILLHRRFGAKPANRSTLGIRIDPGSDPAPTAELIKKDFDLVSVPTNWRQMQPRPDFIDFAAVDRWMLWAKGIGRPIVAGPIVRLTPDSVPAWALDSLRDYAKLKELVWRFMEQLVYRYRELVEIWNVASALHVSELAALTAEDRVDLTRRAALLVRQSRKGARVMVEVGEPFGERVSRFDGSTAPWEYLDQVVQGGIRLDCIGVPVVFGDSTCGRVTRDLMQVSALLDRFFLLETPIIVSALGAPSAEEDPRGGGWRGTWSDQSLARWTSRVVSIMLSKPFVAGVIWDRLIDGRGDGLPRQSGLVDSAGKTKAVLSSLLAIRRRLREPLGPMPDPRSTVKAGAMGAMGAMGGMGSGDAEEGP